MLVMYVLLWLHLGWREFNELMLIILIYFHYTCLIPTSIAIIGSRPYSNQNFLFKIINITLFDKLMSPGYRLHAIKIQELLRDLSWKQIPSTSITNSPPFHIIFRIWPNKITHTSYLRNLFNTFNIINLIQERNTWR